MQICVKHCQLLTSSDVTKKKALLSVTSALDLGVAFGLGGGQKAKLKPSLSWNLSFWSPLHLRGGPASEGRTRYMQPENEEYIVLSNCFQPRFCRHYKRVVKYGRFNHGRHSMWIDIPAMSNPCMHITSTDLTRVLQRFFCIFFCSVKLRRTRSLSPTSQFRFKELQELTGAGSSFPNPWSSRQI